jgi:MFS family permease
VADRAYGVVLLLVPSAGRRAPLGGGYRAAVRDRPFLGVVALNLVWVASTVGLLNSLFPVFAHDQSGVSTHAIGVLFLVNSLTIVALQLPVSRAVEGHRRARVLGLMALVFAAWWALVLVTGARLEGRQAVAVLAVAIAVLAVGECLYDSVQGPLVAGLAPDGSVGRYLAVASFGWQLGFIVAPAVGGVLRPPRRCRFRLPARCSVSPDQWARWDSSSRCRKASE